MAVNDPQIIEINRTGGWTPVRHRVEAAMVNRSLPSKIFERDKYTCQCCGLRNPKSQNYMEIHHINGNHEDNGVRNLATYCPYCHMTHHIDFVGRDRQGTLLLLPEITQVELFHLFRAIHCYSLELTNEKTRNHRTPQGIQTLLDGTMSFLKERSQYLVTMFGNGANDPDEFAGSLRQILTTNEKNEDVLKRGLKYIKVLPATEYHNEEGHNIFPQMVEAWRTYYQDPKKIADIASRLRNVPDLSDMMKPNP